MPTQGSVDGTQNSNQDMKRFSIQPANFLSSRQPKLSIVFLNLRNASVPVLQRAEFRKALMSGINRQMMIDDVLKGQGVLAQGPIMPGNWAYYTEQTPYRYDPDGARQILAGMGLTLSENGRFISDGALIVEFVCRMMPNTWLWQKFCAKIGKKSALA